MLRWITLVLCMAMLPSAAHAFSASCRGDGWAIADGTTLPTHARVVFYMDPQNTVPSTLLAKMAGHDVPTKITWSSAPPFKLATIEIDSDRTGKIDLIWMISEDMYVQHPTASYVIASHVVQPTVVHGTTTRFHRAYSHSTVHESWDGLAVAVDTTVIAFKVHWRRDDKDAWQDLVVPGNTLDIANTLHLGEISCTHNFSVPMLEHGIDLEVTAQLPDGSWVKVSGLPAHYTLPALPPGTPISRP